MSTVLPYPDPDLADDLVVLRRWRLDDDRCIEEAATDPEIPPGTTVPAVYTTAEGRAFIERQWGRHTNGEGISLAIADTIDNRARGLVVLMLRPMRGTAAIGYWIVPAARRRGLATAAVGLASRWALTEAGLARIEAMVEPGNSGSRRVLEVNRFRYEGILRSAIALAESRADGLSFALIKGDLT